MADGNQPLNPNYLTRRRTAAPVSTPVSYQQKEAAVQDPRYAQAIGERVQADVQARQKELQQQTQQFQTQYQQAQTQAPSGQNIQGILEKIRSNTATDQDIAAYQKLMSAQYQGPQAMQIGANIAALRQLAQSPQQLAMAYGGFMPQANVLAQQQALAGQPTGALGAGMQSAQALASQAMGAEQAAATQVAAAQAQAQQLQQQAQQAIKAERAAFEGSLSEEQKAQIEAKKAALDALKRGVFLGQQIKQSDLETLGLTVADLSGLKGFDLSQIGGAEGITSSGALKAEIDRLNKLDLEGRGSEITPEQRRLMSAYGEFESGLARSADEAALYGYAGPENLTRINALRRLSGAPGETSPLTKEDIQKGFASGKTEKEKISALKGAISGYGDYEGQETKEGDLEAANERLSGNKYYEGGITTALSDVKNQVDNLGTSTYESAKQSEETFSNLYDIADNILSTMERNGTKKNSLYLWLKDNIDEYFNSIDKYSTALSENRSSVGYDPQDTSLEFLSAKQKTLDFKNEISKVIQTLVGQKNTAATALSGMSDIFKNLNIQGYNAVGGGTPDQGGGSYLQLPGTGRSTT